MIGDPWPEEPADPFEEYGEPEEALGLDVPSVDDADVPSGLVRTFWGLVGVLNIGLFALAFGAMLIAFRGEWAVGGTIVAVGAVSLGYGVHRYRRYRDDPPW